MVKNLLKLHRKHSKIITVAQNHVTKLEINFFKISLLHCFILQNMWKYASLRQNSFKLSKKFGINVTINAYNYLSFKTIKISHQNQLKNFNLVLV